MPTPRVISDSLLAPISAEKPSGEDLQAGKEWVDLKSARPNPFEVEDKGIWEPVQSNTSSWPLLNQLASAALERKSKDLRIAIWLTEASIRLHQFAGLRDGLRLVRELVMRYWDSGLYPLIIDGDIETRCGPLEWLNEKMAEVARQIPITVRTDQGENYSYVYYQETRRPQGRLSREQFNEAVKRTPRAKYETMLEDFQQACEELNELDQVVEEKVCNSFLSLNGQQYKTPEEAKRAAEAIVPTTAESKAALEEIKVVLDGILREKRRDEPDQPGTPAAAREASEGGPSQSITPALPFLPETGGQTVSNGSWLNAENLVRAGRIDQGLAEMTRLAAAEPNGRARFHRKLVLAEICLSTKREKLAKAILEELAEQIDKFQLEAWESSALVGAVWSRLYRCYKNEQAGTADTERAAKLFERLCRLDPWQALACSEGKYSSLG
jgi:type VI secretion system protein ImpA